jgi:hypothetical protein
VNCNRLAPDIFFIIAGNEGNNSRNIDTCCHPHNKGDNVKKSKNLNKGNQEKHESCHEQRDHNRFLITEYSGKEPGQEDRYSVTEREKYKNTACFCMTDKILVFNQRQEWGEDGSAHKIERPERTEEKEIQERYAS